MKRNLFVFSFVLLTIFCMVSDVSGIGISPARRTFDIFENGGLDTEISYFLFPPQERYSALQPLSPAGLNATVTGCSTSAGIEYLQDGSMLIDWDTAVKSSWDGVEGIWAYVDISTPDNWVNPAVAGGGRYMTDMVRHIEIEDPSGGIHAIAAAISQLAMYRNYAPRAYLQSSATTELAVNLGLQFEDKHETWWANNPEFAWFRYEIDWDNDGVIDQSGNATLDEEAVLQDNLYRWTSGIQISTLDLEHVYETGGNYTAMISVTDLGYVSGETTTFQIPVNVTPEPTTLALLGFGGLFLRKRHR